MLKSLFHWKVLVNLLAAIVVFVGLVWLTFRWLENHTNHGKEIPVPNIMNMSVHDAIKTLDDVGLSYEVDSGNFNPKYRPFQVLNIFPKPGARVKGGRIVNLKVNPRTWAPVQVPDILDRYKGLAFRQLEQVGLKVGDTIFEPSIQRDAVIRMIYNNNTLKPGTILPRFTTIDLVIGSGPMRNIPVPSLVGLTVAEAKAIITNNLFEVGLVEHEDGKKEETDIVYYQDPSVGELRDQGMQIDLWASKKTPAELQDKIAYLNSIYRIKIDTTLPPIYYEKAPSYWEPIPAPPNAKQDSTVKNQVPKTATKPQNKTNEQTKTNTTEKKSPEPTKPKGKTVVE